MIAINNPILKQKVQLRPHPPSLSYTSQFQCNVQFAVSFSDHAPQLAQCLLDLWTGGWTTEQNL